MQVAAHYYVAIYLQALMLLTIADGIKQNMAKLFPAKQINPMHHSQGYKIYAVRVVNLYFSDICCYTSYMLITK